MAETEVETDSAPARNTSETITANIFMCYLQMTFRISDSDFQRAKIIQTVGNIIQKATILSN